MTTISLITIDNPNATFDVPTFTLDDAEFTRLIDAHIAMRTPPRDGPRGGNPTPPTAQDVVNGLANQFWAIMRDRADAYYMQQAVTQAQQAVTSIAATQSVVSAAVQAKV